ncbi:MAG: Rrf2 family transcriptional regulator [Myxococcota bacterium]|jgi:Rrf2 family protein
MRLSLQVQYAICGVFDLAYNAHDEAVQVRVVGERQGIPGRYLEQIFRKLRQAGLVRGKRGPGGGYRLARAPAAISLLDIVEAVEGPIEARAPARPATEVPTYRPDFLWAEVGSRVSDVLRDTHIESLCRQAARRGVRRFRAEALEYQI